MKKIPSISPTDLKNLPLKKNTKILPPCTRRIHQHVFSDGNKFYENFKQVRYKSRSEKVNRVSREPGHADQLIQIFLAKSIFRIFSRIPSPDGRSEKL